MERVEHGLRPTHDRMHLKRVVNRGRIIISVYERHGVTDGIYQIGEVVALGPKFTSEVPISVGDLVLFVQSRVFDHFRWGRHDVLVYPGAFTVAKVTSGILVEEPHLREYEQQPL